MTPSNPAPVGDEREALIARLKQEAQIHAQEARTANATIAEIYQIVTGKTGEPGNWNGAEPVRKCIEELRSRLSSSTVQADARDDEIVEAMRDEMTLYEEGVTVTTRAELIRAVRAVLARFGTRPAAEPSQSGSAGEAELRSVLTAILNSVPWGHSHERLRERACAALSRQAPAAPADAATYRVFMDGNQWCAVGPAFIDLQQSPAGFADTPYLALERLTEAEAEEKRRTMRAADWKPSTLPTPEAEPVQQDTDWRVSIADLILHLHQWQAAPAGDASTVAWEKLQATINALATPPAEKQAAPSGEDNHG